MNNSGAASKKALVLKLPKVPWSGFPEIRTLRMGQASLEESVIRFVGPQNHERREKLKRKGRAIKKHWKHQWSINWTIGESGKIDSKVQPAIILLQYVLVCQCMVFNSKGVAVAKGQC